jgi:hypothetical protein
MAYKESSIPPLGTIRYRAGDGAVVMDQRLTN